MTRGEKKAAYMRAWRAANPEKRGDAQRRYRAAHPEAQKAYYAASREKILERNRGYKRKKRAAEKDVEPIIEAAKRLVAADPMRHWKSPPCS